MTCTPGSASINFLLCFHFYVALLLCTFQNFKLNEEKKKRKKVHTSQLQAAIKQTCHDKTEKNVTFTVNRTSVAMENVISQQSWIMQSEQKPTDVSVRWEVCVRAIPSKKTEGKTEELEMKLASTY